MRMNLTGVIEPLKYTCGTKQDLTRIYIYPYNEQV